MSDVVEPKKTISSVWYMMSLFFGILGGLIVWVTKKDDDHAKAKRVLMLGMVISLLYVAIIVYAQITIYDSQVNMPQYFQDENYTLHCDIRFLDHPTNCLVKDQYGVQITQDTICDVFEAEDDHCWGWSADGKRYLPHRGGDLHLINLPFFLLFALFSILSHLLDELRFAMEMILLSFL